MWIRPSGLHFDNCCFNLYGCLCIGTISLLMNMEMWPLCFQSLRFITCQHNYKLLGFSSETSMWYMRNVGYPCQNEKGIEIWKSLYKTILPLVLPRGKLFCNCKMAKNKINRYKELILVIRSILKDLGGEQQGGGFTYHHFLSSQLLFINTYLLSELG